MNEYISWHHRGVIAFEDSAALITYLHTGLIKPKNLGYFDCTLAGKPYLLSIEPWFVGCLTFWNDKLPLAKRDWQVHWLTWKFTEFHMQRMESFPVEAGYYPEINFCPQVFDVKENLGVSYALVAK